MQERQGSKPVKNATPVEHAAEEQEPEEMDLRPNLKLKTVGKIDLESLNKPQAAPKEEPVKEERVQNSEKELKQAEPVSANPAIESQEVPMKEETPEVKSSNENKEEQGGVFKIRPTEFKSSINVLGKIDLDALNQSTRPKKKTKEEKKKHSGHEYA